MNWEALIENHAPWMIISVAMLWAVAYIGRRMFGKEGLIPHWGERLMGDDGIITKTAANMVECNAKNSETLSKLEATSSRQQELCTRHATMVETITGQTSAIYEKWGEEERLQYQNGPVLDALLHATKMACEITAKNELSWKDDAERLHEEVQKIRERVNGGS